MTTYLLITGWLAGWILLWRLPTLERRSSGAAHRISVVIPARNEADRLPLLLESLRTQTRPPDQIVVVDDHSDDGTAARAAAFDGVTVVAAPDVPHGWTGKSWACETGAARADGDALVFLDADVELAPDALEALVATWEARGGLLSVQPHHHIVRPVEALSLPFNVVALMGLGVGSLLPPRHGWGAAGPCMITSRADYDAAGGHRAVRRAVAEDLALADRFAEAGLPVQVRSGGADVRFRMYRNLHGLFEGWSKNVATGARRTPLLRSIGVGLWVTSLLVAVGAVFAGSVPIVADRVDVAVLYALVGLQLAVLGRRVGRFGLAAAAWPVLAVFFVAVFTWSAGRTFLLRQVRWSGRTLHLSGGDAG
ncbi:MAG: glycosyltransferase [Actinobacteria bacterium]|nr:glycosyltransferase [Actinomycetota bacterium]